MALSCFAWNKDGSKLAVCPNSTEIWIYKTNKNVDTSKWEKIQVLKEVRIHSLINMTLISI